MKFDMTAAWNDATRLIAANRQVIAIVAGVFFFLPYVAFMLMFMDQMATLEAAQAGNPDPKAMGAAVVAFYGSIWWVILLLSVIQAIGMIGLMVLLTDRGRPTVGEALKVGARLFLTYIVAQLLFSLALALLIVIPIAVGAGVSVAVGVVLGIVALVGVCYLFAKFLLAPAVIAVERQANPIAALGRSWRLSKGNSLRLFLFVFLLLMAIGVIGGVFSLVTGLLFAIGGAEVARIGQAITSGLVNAIFTVVFLGVLVASYRQLAGPSAETIRDTFD